MDFSVFNLHPLLAKALEVQQFSCPTAIQKEAIPALLQGRDVLGIAPTGTGKTEAFAIPIIQQLLVNPTEDSRPLALIISPTRELALQTFNRFEALISAMPLTAACIYGGKSYDSQLAALAKAPQIIVATPGRLLDLVDQKLIDLNKIQQYILDEGDQLLDLGFLASIHLLKKVLPSSCQKALFSATFPETIAKLGNQLLIDPLKISLVSDLPKAAISDFICFVDKVDKKKLILFLLQEFKLKQLLIFTRTTAAVDRIVADLRKNELAAEGLYGDKGQLVREQTIAQFRQSHTQVLVATDIAARGIDIPALSAIINYEIPDTIETYTHRIGRTGRASEQGFAFTFCDAEENSKFITLQMAAKKTFAIYDQHPYLLSWEKMLSTKQVQPKGKAKKKLRK